jgi:hypothetical protein
MGLKEIVNDLCTILCAITCYINFVNPTFCVSAIFIIKNRIKVNANFLLEPVAIFFWSCKQPIKSWILFSRFEIQVGLVASRHSSQFFLERVFLYVFVISTCISFG